MQRRSLLTGLLGLVLTQPLLTVGSQPVLAASRSPCTYNLPDPTKQSVWGQRTDLDAYTPTHASVDPQTGDVTYYFKRSRPITVNPSKPVPDPATTNWRSQHLVKHLHKVAKVYQRECGILQP